MAFRGKFPARGCAAGPETVLCVCVCLVCTCTFTVVCAPVHMHMAVCMCTCVWHVCMCPVVCVCVCVQGECKCWKQGNLRALLAWGGSLQVPFPGSEPRVSLPGQVGEKGSPSPGLRKSVF